MRRNWWAINSGKRVAVFGRPSVSSYVQAVAIWLLDKRSRVRIAVPGCESEGRVLGRLDEVLACVHEESERAKVLGLPKELVNEHE